MFEIFRKLIGKLKGDKSGSSLSVTNTDQSRKNKKIKKNKGQFVDDSSDCSTNVTGDSNTVNSHNISEINNYYGEESASSDLVVVARWYNRIPYKREPSFDLGVQTISLVPSEPNFIFPTFTVNLSEQCDDKNALYILIQRNSFIKNLKLKAVRMNLDVCKYESTESKSLFGLLNTPKAFLIQCSEFRVGDGEIVLIFGFDKQGKHYEQTFTFTAINNSSEFVIKEYVEPKRVINLDHFSF